jgi:hypothetical protein
LRGDDQLENLALDALHPSRNGVAPSTYFPGSLRDHSASPQITSHPVIHEYALFAHHSSRTRAVYKFPVSRIYSHVGGAPLINLEKHEVARPQLIPWGLAASAELVKGAPGNDDSLLAVHPAGEARAVKARGRRNSSRSVRRPELGAGNAHDVFCLWWSRSFASERPGSAPASVKGGNREKRYEPGTPTA